jgi:hypothetical protein
MRKICFVLISIVFLILSNSYGISASALGLTPAITKLEYKPNLNFSIIFNVMHASSNQVLEISSDGSFKDYVKFDKTNITGSGSFNVYVSLPEKTNLYGVNKLYIIVKEKVKETVGIGVAIELIGTIVITVPYPGKYLQINNFEIPDINSGEPLKVSFEVESLGDEKTEFDSYAEIYSQDKIIEKILFDKAIIESREKLNFKKTINKLLKPGVYNSTLYVNYDSKFADSNLFFKVGTLYVTILDYTKNFVKDKINEFRIEIESQWNNDLKNVYAEVNVSDLSGVFVDYFKTPSIDLYRWQKSTLKGFFNCNNVSEGLYKAKITLFFDNLNVTKTVDINVNDSEKPFFDKYIVVILLIVVIVFVLFLITIIILVFITLKTNSKNVKKR